MTSEQALNMIINATALLQLNRKDHENISLALNVLEGVIEEKVSPKK